MHGRALSPSPIALLLLGLAERGADGSVDVGGRQVLLRKGQVVEVRPGEGDGDFATFLRDSGRVAAEPLERCVRKAQEEDLPLEEVLQRQRLLSEDTVREVRRGLWLDRLVRGMNRATAEGREPAPLHPEVRVPANVPVVSLVTLVLDALERRAAEDDAGQVGSRADHSLEWLPGPHLERAQRWARFDVKNVAVAGLLKTEPAAAPRIAALVRAGLARIVSPDAPPAPHSRMPFIPPPGAPSRPTPPLGSPAQPERISVLPMKLPSVQLDPGLAPILADAPELAYPLPELPTASERLGDPLDALERAIALLEQAGASGAERAAAWRDFAAAWHERFGSVEESARAYREAAAAEATDRVSLDRASELCAALGQADLAVAYARASVSASPEGIERARALFRHALLCRRLGKVSEALGAVRAAASADPSDPSPSALAVHLWRELGRPRDAAQAAMEAAERLRASDPRRALSLVALAQGLDPSSIERAETYANELADNGLIEAAIAVRADAVRKTRDPDVRRTLRLAAAEQAEQADRPEVAADLLMLAFDDEPHLDLLYEPLDIDLANAGATLERALLLEEIAAAASPEMQAGWLTRAANARLDVPDEGAWEAELRIRALELEPEDDENLRALRDLASARGDERLLADALERAIARGRWMGTQAQRSAIEELARLCNDVLRAPTRAAWAWERLRAFDPADARPDRELERLRPALDAHRERRQQLEGELAAASSDRRLEALRHLADHLRDDPERRRHAVGLYREAFDAGPDDSALGDALERLLRLAGDDDGELDTLAVRAEHASARSDRLRALHRIASLGTLIGRLRDVAWACRRLLEELPSHREASVRLRRAASRLGDDDLLREALAQEARAALPAATRARLLTALARELEHAGSIDEAISCAEEALSADPQSAEAALLVTRHLESLEQPRAALGIVRALFGDSPPILETWARVARTSGEREAMLEALDAWASVAPFDPEPALMRLAAFPFAETAGTLAQTIEAALTPERLVPGLARPVADAIGRLADLGAEPLRQAAALAVRAADAFGPHGDALRELAGQLATATGTFELRCAALERRIAPQMEQARVELLHELATLHRDRNDRAAEARTHLRVLAVHPHERRSLARLQAIYAETGELERLMAALALELEAAPLAERLAPLLTLASASAHLRGDLDRAEGFLRDAWSPTLPDERALFTAAGALVSLGRARRAVELLREGGRQLGPERAGPVFLRAVQTAIKKVGDSRLALSVATEGIDHAPRMGPLLLAFEQLALELADVDTAERTYRRMIDRAMGPHGRRALLYRRARWLERAVAPRAALDAYLEAFERSPQAGAVYTSVERLARNLGDLPSLVRAALLLAEKAGHPAVQATMAREAARLLEQELGEPDRAFEVLVKLWEAGDPEVEDDCTRLAADLRGRDPQRGEAAFARMLAVLRHRVDDAWLADAKARLLLRQGRLHALGRADVDAAGDAIDEALGFLREDGGGEPDLVADLNLELAAWLLAAGEFETAGDRVRQALAARPDHEGARLLSTQLGVAVPPSRNTQPMIAAPEDEGTGVPSDVPTAAPEPPPTRKTLPAGGGVPQPAVGVPAHDDRFFELNDAASRWRSAEPPSSAPPPPESDIDAIEGRALARMDIHPRESLEMLRNALAQRPDRIATARSLRTVASALGAEGYVTLTTSLLSLLEPDQPAPPPWLVHADDVRALVREPEWDRPRALWRLLWEQALPLFRENLDTSQHERIAPAGGAPPARALAAALAAMRRNEGPPLFFDRASPPRVAIHRTSPPSLIAGPQFGPTEAAMRFALGRALELAEPESLLLATLPADRAIVVAEGVRAAFGPTDEGPVSRPAAGFASELWRTVPTRGQSAFRDLLADTDEFADYEGTANAVKVSGIRAGLIASGDLATAVRMILALDPETAALRIEDEDSFARAVEASEPLAAALRFAFGPLVENVG